jgi:methylated-DNA-[protein]-cysteine S-methyltransferase
MTRGDHEEIAFLRAPFGWVRLHGGLQHQQHQLYGLGLLPSDAVEQSLSPPRSPVLLEVAAELMRYFDEPSVRLTLPDIITGTRFQQRVWNALSLIPPGRVESYSSLARIAGGGPRALAAACKANRFPIMIPCHRAVALNGLGGFCGQRNGPMLEIKRWLLLHEGYSIQAGSNGYQRR